MLAKRQHFLWLIFYTLMILVVAACSTNTSAPASSITKGSPHTSSSTASPTPRLGAPGCHPPSPLDYVKFGLPGSKGYGYRYAVMGTVPGRGAACGH
jgi:hypothetical protein